MSKYREIPLTRGYVAIVDAEDYERVAQFKWCALVDLYKDGTVRTVYGRRSIHKGGRRNQQLHRFIMGVTDPTIDVDHRDGNGLNCTRENLRTATRSQNIANRGLQWDNKSGFKGVHWGKSVQKWVAQIETRVNGRRNRQCLGYFVDPVAAARRYDEEAIVIFGEFAVLNFPQEKSA